MVKEVGGGRVKGGNRGNQGGSGEKFARWWRGKREEWTTGRMWYVGTIPDRTNVKLNHVTPSHSSSSSELIYVPTRKALLCILLALLLSFLLILM